MVKPALLAAVLSFALGFPTDARGQRIRDTDFILREISTPEPGHTLYRAVFIDTRKASPYYRLIENFDFAHQQSPARISSKFGDSLVNAVVDKRALSELPHNWCPLRQYHGKYFVYTREFNKLSIKDSSVIFTGIEGPVARTLYAFKKVGVRTFRMKVARAADGIQTILIHLIDPKKQVAVFQYQNGKDHRIRYELMVGAERIRSFPIIVDYAPDVKPQVFMFEEPDFQALLGGY